MSWNDALAALPVALGRGHHRALRLGIGAFLLVAVIVLLAVVVTALLRHRTARRRGPTGPTGPTGSAGPAGPAAPRRADDRAALTVTHLVKTYRMGGVPVRALRDVSLDVRAGAMVCITGRSGSGKSTLLRQLGLLDRPTDGRILLHGREVTGLSEGARARLRLRRLGYVFQEYALLPELTARENVYLPALMLGGRTRACRERAEELLDAVGLADRARHLPRQLSGGEQQRVAIARALVNKPSVVFADEPTANLDTAAARTVMETLRSLNEGLGITVVFVSHEPDDARYASQLVHLSNGSIEPENVSEVPS
jgi:putative ABC transport system ATP-binding protein